MVGMGVVAVEVGKASGAARRRSAARSLRDSTAIMPRRGGAVPTTRSKTPRVRGTRRRAGGILVCVFTGWFWGRERVAAELSNRGALENGAVQRALVFLVRWVSPVLIAVVMLRGFGVV
jgi:hypothetical protein